MKMLAHNLFRLFVLTSFFAFTGCGPNGEELLRQAKEAAEDKDETLATELVLKSADKGCHEAMIMAGGLYLRGGKGVEPNKQLGFSLIRKAAEEKYPDGMYVLAQCYRSGLGAELDLDKAKYWENLAFEAESPLAMYAVAENSYANIANASRTLRRIDSNFEYSAGDKAAMKQAVSIYKRLIGEEKFSNRVDVASICVTLGKIYEEGAGVSQNSRTAISYYERAIKLGSKQAMRELGLLYFNGKYVAKNYDKAVPLLKRCMEGRRDAYILQRLGKIYMDEKWPSCDVGTAKSYFEDAIYQHDRSEDHPKHDFIIEDSLALLGRILLFEDEKYRDETKGIELLERAVEEHNYEAKYYLAVAYCEGIGVEKDLEKAEDLLLTATCCSNKEIAREAEKLQKEVKKALGHNW